MRALIALVLVLHYLLIGVLGGAWATVATRAAAPTAARPYVHSADCQAHNYLRLDCFDQCKGVPTGQILKKLLADDAGSAGAAATSKSKASVDVHVLGGQPALSPAGACYGTALGPVPGLRRAGVTPGFVALEGPPPKAQPASAG